MKKLNVTVDQMANGWTVSLKADSHRSSFSYDDIYVFNDFVELCRHLAKESGLVQVGDEFQWEFPLPPVARR